MVMMWSAPATESMLATSLAEMGARLWGGKVGGVSWGGDSTLYLLSDRKSVIAIFLGHYLEVVLFVT